MSLSCECDDWTDGYYEVDPKFFTMSFPCGCYSCEEMISQGDVVLPIHFFSSIYEEDDDIAEDYDAFLCKRCAEIFLNLDAAGFCISLPSDLREDLEEYWDLVDFDPDKYTEIGNDKRRKSYSFSR